MWITKILKYKLLIFCNLLEQHRCCNIIESYCTESADWSLQGHKVNCIAFLQEISSSLLPYRFERAGGVVKRPTSPTMCHSNFPDWRWQGEEATKANEWVRRWERRSLLWAVTLAMPAKSRLPHWMTGSGVILEVKLSFADKQAAINMFISYEMPLINMCTSWALIQNYIWSLWSWSWILNSAF